MAGSLSDRNVVAAIRAARTPPAGALSPFASPADWRDGWIYFLMVDRFSNPGAPPAHQPYDDPDYYAFQGGTFRGVQAQLKYIKNLGASAIWISPALKNPGWDAGTYHGYGIHDFLVAEPRFATSPATADAELRDLVDAAHAAGLWVIFDIVLNHVGNVFAYSPNDPGTVPGVSFSPQPLPVYWRLPDGTPRPDPTPIEQITGSTGGDLVWPSELQQNEYFRRQGNPQAGGDDTIGDFRDAPPDAHRQPGCPERADRRVPVRHRPLRRRRFPHRYAAVLERRPAPPVRQRGTRVRRIDRQTQLFHLRGSARQYR